MFVHFSCVSWLLLFSTVFSWFGKMGNVPGIFHEDAEVRVAVVYSVEHKFAQVSCDDHVCGLGCEHSEHSEHSERDGDAAVLLDE